MKLIGQSHFLPPLKHKFNWCFTFFDIIVGLVAELNLMEVSEVKMTKEKAASSDNQNHAFNVV